MEITLNYSYKHITNEKIYTPILELVNAYVFSVEELGRETPCLPVVIDKNNNSFMVKLVDAHLDITTIKRNYKLKSLESRVADHKIKRDYHERQMQILNSEWDDIYNEHQEGE